MAIGLKAITARAARHAPLVLILGLVAGAGFPSLALAMRPWIGEMVAGLLFLAALRVGPRQTVGALGDIGASLGLAGALQVGMPLAAMAVFALLGWTGSALATFFVLLFAAAPVTGSPHFISMTGNDPAPALRQLVLGTALLPLTVVPVFWLTPAFGDPRHVLTAAGGLMLLIGLSASLAFLIRATAMKEPSAEAIQSIDGVSAIAMAIVVIGLMSAVGPTLRERPLDFLAILGLVCLANFTVQAGFASIARMAGWNAGAAALGVVAANRNVALFLTVLPERTVDPILLFIGCYQIPMYLTPAVMGRFYMSMRPSAG